MANVELYQLRIDVLQVAIRFSLPHIRMLARLRFVQKAQASLHCAVATNHFEKLDASAQFLKPT